MLLLDETQWENTPRILTATTDTDWKNGYKNISNVEERVKYLFDQALQNNFRFIFVFKCADHSIPISIILLIVKMLFMNRKNISNLRSSEY